MKYTHYQTMDFVSDNLFCLWILSSNPELASFWEEWLIKNPGKANEVKKATAIILALSKPPDDPNISQDMVNKIWNNILLITDAEPK